MKYFITDNVECLCSEGAQSEGHVIEGHAHYHDHLTVCHSGSYLVQKLAYENGPVVEETIITANSQFPAVEVKASIFHRLTALEDGSRYMCIHACHSPEGVLTIKRSGWETPETAGARLCLPGKEI